MNFSSTDEEEEEAVVVEEEDLILEGSEAVVLAEDLILDILLRLPPVSVVRFKCVSKSWYSLITNPCFLKNHARLLRSQRLLDPLVLMSNVRLLSSQLVHPRLPSSNYRDSTKLYVISTQDQDEPEKPHPFLKVFLDDSLADFRQKFSRCFLIDSCNGLLLYHATNRNLDTRYQYIVFNPITSQYKEVPIMDLLQTFEAEDAKEIYVCGFPRIVFDPSISVSYKLIACLYHGKPRSNYAFYFYSADTNSWRLSTSFDDEDNSVIGRKTFMFDGVFYWLKRDVSICFDAVKENVWFLPLPPIPSDCFNRDVVYFGERNGRLRLIEEYNSLIRNDGWSFPCSFDIMEMDMGSKIWTVKSRVNFVEGYDHLIQHNIYDPFYCGFVRVVHLYETEKGEEAILLSVDYEKLVSFNLTTNTFGKEFTIPHIIDYRYLEAFSFTPTLFPLLT